MVGKTFFRHYPNHGFVGDVFTVNGTAYPVLEVKRRKYRFRCLDASIARIYELSIMSSTCGPVPAPGNRDSSADGQQSMQFTQIATDGGDAVLIVRNSFELCRPSAAKSSSISRSTWTAPDQEGDVVYP
jgi:hypothetical protein